MAEQFRHPFGSGVGLAFTVQVLKSNQGCVRQGSFHHHEHHGDHQQQHGEEDAEEVIHS
jgi:hypothetical protein